MSRATLQIGARIVGEGHPPYLIAELSANHLGKRARALETMEAARDAGADAVKLQTYTADTITIEHDGPGFVIEGGPWDGRSLHELYREAHTPWEWHEALFEKGRALGLDVFSSPFDASAIEFLERFDPPAYKIASFEIVDPALIARAAATGKPLIISTGMADRAEIARAVEAAAPASGVCLLHCVSAYPAPAGEANLRTIPHLAKSFGVVCGLSDHTLGTGVAVAAVTLGAGVIEKHFTLERAAGGPDAAFSLEPDEFAAMASGCRTAWAALGQVHYGPTPSEEANLQFRRSLYVVADIAKGEPFTERNLRSIRPGFGLPPRMIDDIMGRTASRDLARGTPLDRGCVAWPPGARTD